MAYYMCFKHKKPFYGGLYDCAEALELDDVLPEDLLCEKCVMRKCGGGKKKVCKKHGLASILWKCKFCCEPGLYFCGGTTHFCQSCHIIQESGVFLNKKSRKYFPKCLGIEGGCPLDGEHPPKGEEYLIGCQVCRMEEGKAPIPIKIVKEVAKTKE